MDELISYKKFKDLDIAKDISEKLKLEGVYFEIENEKQYFDPTFANNPMQNDFRIKIEPSNYYVSLLNRIQEDYYLFSFTNKELFEIISKPDEWGDLDYQLAKKILKDRGEEITNEQLQNLKDKRINVLSKPETSQTVLVIFGYAVNVLGILSLFIHIEFRLIWLPIAIIMGAILSQTKTVLPNGEVVFSYNETDRKHGKIIGLLCMLLILLILILLYFNKIEIIQNKIS
jgi:hypothetical protein